MIDIASFLKAVAILSHFKMIFLIVIGMAYGMIMGAMPGITATLAIGIILGPTFFMEPIEAIVLLSAIYTGGIYAGGVTAIILNIPGTPASIATTFDGYQMARQGRQNQALGLGLGASAVGDLLSYLILLFFMVPLAKFVIKFGPPEMLMIVVCAFSIIGIVGGDLIKALLAGVFGLIIGTLGAGLIGVPRGTFGIPEMYEGIPIVPMLIGVFAIPELLFLIERKTIVDEVETMQADPKLVLKGFFEALSYRFKLIRSTIIGMLVGLLPAAGSAIAGIVSHAIEKQGSDNPDAYGKGEPRGVVAAEAANNGSEAGAMAIMMTFGIPGSSSTAMILAAFIMHGLIPGPFLLRDSMDLVYAIIMSDFISAVVLIFLGLLLIKYFGKTVIVPTNILIPVIAFLAVLGTLSLRRLILDPILVLIFGVIGYFMRKADYPLVCLVLGVILGNRFEHEMIRIYRAYSGQWLSLFSRPIFVSLIILTILVLLYPVIRSHSKKLLLRFCKRTA